MSAVPVLGPLTEEQKKAYMEAVEKEASLPERFTEDQMMLDPSYDDEYVRDYFSKDKEDKE